MDKGKNSKNHKKGKSSTDKSNQIRDDLESKKEVASDDTESQKMQAGENWTVIQNRKSTLIAQKEPAENSKERLDENVGSKQSLNIERSTSLGTKKPTTIENASSVESVNHTEKVMPPRAMKHNLIETEPLEHHHKRKKSIVPPFKKSSLLETEPSDFSQSRKKSVVKPFKRSASLEDEQTEHSANRMNSSTSSKKLSFERESSEQSIHKKKSVSSPRKKSRSLETVSSDEDLKTDSKLKSKSKKRKSRQSSEERKKRKKTRKIKSREKKRRDPSPHDSDNTDSSRETTPPVVIVDWSRRCKSMEQKVKKAIKSQKVVVFAKKETDTNIEEVKNLMAQYCVTYGLVELDDSPYFETQLYNMTCCRCLPLIFIDGMFLGSLFELKTLESMGRMKELLSKKVRKH